MSPSMVTTSFRSMTRGALAGSSSTETMPAAKVMVSAPALALAWASASRRLPGPPSLPVVTRKVAIGPGSVLDASRGSPPGAEPGLSDIVDSETICAYAACPVNLHPERLRPGSGDGAPPQLRYDPLMSMYPCVRSQVQAVALPFPRPISTSMWTSRPFMWATTGFSS